MHNHEHAGAAEAMSRDHLREVRGAESQSLFRDVNEKVHELNESFAELAGALTVVCECAETACTALVELPLGEYEAIRAHPNRFLVTPGHVDYDIERVVGEHDGYVVVEKFAEDVAVPRDPRV